jgi:NADH:ubiquinone oxidoreductase subunit 5 (subunit L)/multisubunit Na+/H+ antiporter MnhA subunit
MFHLVTHAFFKSLLFLGAGSVIQALHGEHDIKRMGGLAPHMRLTAYAFLIGALASAGIFPLASFWSQGQILLAAFNGGQYFVWLLALSAALLTAFYMFRLYLLTFSGRFRGDPHKILQLRRAPANMWIPLVILSLLTVAVGFVGVTPEYDLFHSFLGQQVPLGSVQGSNAPLTISMALLPLVVASAGVGLAYLSYAQWWDLPHRLRTLYVLFFRRYFLDEIYYAIFLDGFRWLCRRLWRIDRKLIDGAVNTVVSLVMRSSATWARVDEKVVDGAVNTIAALVLRSGAASSKVDQTVVDGAVNGIGDFVLGWSAISSKVDVDVVDAAVDGLADLNQRLSEILRRVQTGLIQNYLLAMALGIVLIAGFFVIFQ